MEDLAREAAEVILLVLAEVGLGDGTAGGGTAAASAAPGGMPAPAGGRWRRHVRWHATKANMVAVRWCWLRVPLRVSSREKGY